jgi:hypothetical protein
LDEVEPKAEADNTNQGLDHYRYHCEKPNAIIVLLYNLYKRKVNKCIRNACKPRHFEKLSKNELSVGMTSCLQTILLSVDIICRCDVTTNDMRISCVFVANQK